MKKSSLNIILLAGGLTLLAAPSALSNEGLGKFRQMDTNNDGRLTDTERSEFAARHFQECDHNDDDQITVAELAAGGRQGQGMSQQDAAAHLSLVDANGDGLISRAENQDYADESFNRADYNSDGILHPREFQRAHQNMKQKVRN